MPGLDLSEMFLRVTASFVMGNSDMHLKNFSLYSTKPVNYILTPAYDLLSTKLVLPADSEELALTLNGKEKKIKKSDFVVAMNSIGLEDKIIENVFNKFDHLQSKWEEFIDVSFIQETTKERYKELIHENWKRIK